MRTEHTLEDLQIGGSNIPHQIKIEKEDSKCFIATGIIENKEKIEEMISIKKEFEENESSEKEFEAPVAIKKEFEEHISIENEFEDSTVIKKEFEKTIGKENKFEELTAIKKELEEFIMIEKEFEEAQTYVSYHFYKLLLWVFFLMLSKIIFLLKHLLAY